MAAENAAELNGHTIKGSFGLPSLRKGEIFVEKAAPLVHELEVQQVAREGQTTPTTLVSLVFDTSRANAVYRAWHETMNPAIEPYIDY